MKGQSLIELLIASGIIALVLIGIVYTSSRSVSTQVYSRTQVQATKLAEEQLERVLAFRDQNGLAALTCATKCSIRTSTPPLVITPTTSANNMNIWFEVGTPGACPTAGVGVTQFKQVTAYAQWVDSTGTHQSKLTKCFAQWR